MADFPVTDDRPYGPKLKTYVDEADVANAAAIAAEIARAEAAEADLVAGTGGLVAANNLSDLINNVTARTNLGLGTAATSATGDFDPVGAAAEAQALSQPVDTDLTAIAALATTAYGRGLLTLANTAALLTAVGAIPESQVTNLTTDLAAKAPINNPTFTGTVTLAADATTGLQAVTYQQMLAIATGGTPKAAVACASTANLTLSGEQTIDGVLTSASRVLVAGQTTGSQNGIYVSAAGAWARSTDCDQAAEFINGSLIPVSAGGTTYGGKVFIMLAPSPFTVGTSVATFSAVGATYSAGTGITLTGSSFSIDTSVTVDKTTAQTMSAKTLTSPVLNTGVSGTAVDTDSTMAANSDTLLASQKAVKTALATKQPVDADLTTIAGLTATTDNFMVAVASAWASRTPAQVRTTLGLVIGTDVQAFDSDLAAIAALTTTTFGRSLLAAADAAALRTLAGSVIGTDVQAFDTDLLTIAGLTATTDNIIQSVAGAWASRTPAQVRTALGLVPGTDVAAASEQIIAGTGLTGGGNLTADRTLALDAATQATLASVTTLTKVLAGWTVPTNALDKWKAGRSRQATRLTVAINSAVTAIPVKDPSIAPTTLHRRLWMESEEVFTTAGEGGFVSLTGVTSVATTGIFTKTAHGLVAGQPVQAVANILDSFLTINVFYYVSATNLAANTFSLAATVGGAVLTGTTNDTNLTINISQLTVTRGINGSTAASHADKAPVYSPKHKTVVHLGDSIVEGTDNTPQANDGWTLRAARMLSDRMGGLVAHSWPLWRNTGSLLANQEYVLTGSAGLATNNFYDCGYNGAVVFTAGSGNGFVWTRPAGLRVQAIDFQWIDWHATGGTFSYSIDGGTTWVDLPASAWTSGKGVLRRIRIACNDPTDFRARAANTAGTSKTMVVPYGTPVTTWTTYPYTAITEGVHWANLGAAGVKLRTILNARVITDGVTNGTTTLTSATAAFVANDVNSTIYLNGVAYTIASRTNATTVVLSGSPATATGVRVTILQGSGTGDWMASFLGHHGSWFPDLVIIGPFTNDIVNGGSNGDGNYDFYGDMIQFLITGIQPVAEIVVVAPYESGSQPAGIQTSYRTTIATIAATNNVACFNLYDAFVAYGFTGYAAVAAGGYLADTIHFNYKGNNWMGAHLARGLAEL